MKLIRIELGSLNRNIIAAARIAKYFDYKWPRSEGQTELVSHGYTISREAFEKFSCHFK